MPTRLVPIQERQAAERGRAGHAVCEGHAATEARGRCAGRLALQPTRNMGGRLVEHPPTLVMALEFKYLIRYCVECGEEFEWTPSEQEYAASRGWPYSP